MGDHHDKHHDHEGGRGHEGGHLGFKIGTRGPGDAPGPHGDKMGPLREALIDLGTATKQIAHNGTDEQKAEALEVLVDARKKFYGMLAS
jgi:hypothetical protein